jgi:putative ABC transport system substrate-binding protein
MLFSRHTKRRTFIGGLGSAAAWPVVGRAQQPAVPTIGWLTVGLIDYTLNRIPALSEGLAQAGYVEGRNLVIDRRVAEYHIDRLPALATELVRRRVAVILSTSLPATLAAKAATQSIPIVFVTGVDPVKSGLVANLNRPGGNVTGFTNLGTELAAKRLEVFHELVPTATVIGFLVNPTTPFTADEVRETQAAASTLGVRLLVATATQPDDFDAAFATLKQQGAGALLLSEETLFLYSTPRLVALAARHAVPTMYWDRAATRAGGLLSYGTDLNDTYRQAGGYIGRILKGEQPAGLPVQQSTKVELALNLETAKRLGMTFPTGLLVRADEVIE